MRERLFGTACVLVLCGAVPSLAQQTGPRTLEGLLKSRDAHDPPVANPSQKRPAGAIVRPEDGVKHPDLDQAWAVYNTAVEKAAEGIRAAIAKQFDAAAAKGDLDGAEKWQTLLEKFEKAGDLPAEKEAKAAVSAAAADYKKAGEELAKVYEAVVKALTIDKKIAEAKAARDEWTSVRESRLGDPPNAELAKSVSTETPPRHRNSGIPHALAKRPWDATLFITCDNAYEVWLNGQRVGAGNDWTKLGQYPLQIREGDVLAICASDQGPGARTAGLFCCLVLSDGRAWGTGKDWHCSTAVPPPGWQILAKALPGEVNASEENIAGPHFNRGRTYGGKITGQFIWSADAAQTIWVRQVIDFSRFR